MTRAIDQALVPVAEQRGTLEDLRLALAEALNGGLGHPECDGSPARHSQTLVQRRPLPPREDPPVKNLSAPPARRLALPRALWLGCALVGIVWQVWGGRPGAALLLLAAAAPLALLPRCSGFGWLTAALAPVLGLAGLAGAFPVLAGQRARCSERAALAALGYWWLTLAEPLLERRLWLGGSAGAAVGIPSRSVWESSLGSAAVHVVGPALSLGVLFGAGVWALGSVLLPWIVRGRSAALDVLAATTWSAALLAASSPGYGGLVAHVSSAVPYGAIRGALLGGALAVAARAVRGPA